jgi:hypothetical protein
MKFHQVESKSKCMKCIDNQAVISWVNWTQQKKPVNDDTVTT